jgi:hypothetical protein
VGLVMDGLGPQAALVSTAVLSVAVGMLFLKFAPESYSGGK